jgi:hypothetical protein
MTRRGLIRRLLLIFTASAGLPWPVAGRQEVEAAQPVQAGDTPAPALSASELDDLVAFGEVVVGSGPLSPLERGFLIDHIQYRLPRADGHYFSAYRTTVGLLRRLAGVRFSSMDVEQRRALVTRYRLGTARVWPDEELGPFPDDVRTVRTQVVADLIGGYYRSPAGWAVVGYDAHPGRCSDLARYTVANP